MSVVQVKENPNIHSCQFVVDHSFFGDEMWESSSIDEAEQYPLAKSLWAQAPDTITQVFFHDNIIVIQKKENTEWKNLIETSNDIVEDYFKNEKLIIANNNVNDVKFDNQDEELNTLILEVIRDYIQPYIAEHGGFIKFHGFSEGIVYISMHGSCSGCPSSAATLNQVVENVLRLKVPGVDLVKLID